MKLEEKLQNALELFHFKDGTIYVLNTMGRNRTVNAEDIEAKLYDHIDTVEEKRKWIRQILHKQLDKTMKLMGFLQLKAFGDYVAEVYQKKIENMNG